MSDAIVIIPTYNEIENIEPIIDAVFNLQSDFHVLVVDDNSPDGTAEKVKELLNTYDNNKLFIEERSEKSGLGTAYIHGFKWCLQRNYDYIFEMDADFSHNPKDLELLYETCQNEADVAIGSRYIKGVNVVNWPLSRVLLSYMASIYVRIITGMRIHDPTAGFICYRRQVLEAIDLDNVKFIGYAFQIEMKFKAHKKKFKIKEIPIVFTDRVRGESKLSGKIISEAIFGVIQLKFNSIFGKS